MNPEAFRENTGSVNQLGMAQAKRNGREKSADELDDCGLQCCYQWVRPCDTWLTSSETGFQSHIYHNHICDLGDVILSFCTYSVFCKNKGRGGIIQCLSKFLDCNPQKESISLSVVAHIYAYVHVHTHTPN